METLRSVSLDFNWHQGGSIRAFQSNVQFPERPAYIGEKLIGKDTDGTIRVVVVVKADSELIEVNVLKSL